MASPKILELQMKRAKLLDSLRSIETARELQALGKIELELVKEKLLLRSKIINDLAG